MKDFDANTPGIIRAQDMAAVTRFEKWLHHYKIASTPLKVYLRDNCHELAIIKENLPHGMWTKLLKSAGIPRTTADRWVKVDEGSNAPNGAFEIFDDDSEDEEGQGVAPTGTGVASPDAPQDPQTPPQPDLFGGSGDTQPAALPKGWKKCPLCKSKKARDSSKCDTCKTLNAPPTAETPEVEEKPEETGPDPTDYNSFWKRIGKTLGKRIKQMRNALVIPRQDLDAARDAYAALSKFISKHAAAETKPQEAGTCKKCGAEVVWTTTSSHSRIPLDVKPGGGVWEVIEGVAHFCDWDKDAAKFRFRCHSARCVSNKPIPD